jgi:hypothetical protein
MGEMPAQDRQATQGQKMTEASLKATPLGLVKHGFISADDVRFLRAELFRDGVVSRAEAEQLFRLHAENADQCEEWHAFFVEAIVDHAVCQEKPSGYISEESAAWLIRMLSRGAVVGSAVEMELLVCALEQAKSSPAGLSAFALGQVALSAIDGKGPVAAARSTACGAIEKHEVDLLRRTLYAFGGDGNIAITRAEAEILFRINDGTCEEMNHPAWNELFVKAIANFVLASSGYEVPSRAEALRHDAFFDDADVDLGGFFARMVSGGVAGMLNAYEAPNDVLEADFAELNRDKAVKAQRASAVRGDEARWLADRIMNDRLIHDNERALLGFIRQAATAIHPDLKPLLEKVA